MNTKYRNQLSTSSLSRTKCKRDFNTLSNTSRYRRFIRWLWTLLPISLNLELGHSVDNLAYTAQHEHFFSLIISYTWWMPPIINSLPKQTKNSVNCCYFADTQVYEYMHRRSHACTTKRQRISIWFPSRCHKARWRETPYILRYTALPRLTNTRKGSTGVSDFRTRLLWKKCWAATRRD